MKLTGFLLLASGWAIVIASLLLLRFLGSRAAFMLAGLAVQILGLALAALSHRRMELERG